MNVHDALSMYQALLTAKKYLLKAETIGHEKDSIGHSGINKAMAEIDVTLGALGNRKVGS